MDAKRILLVLPLMAVLCLTSACDEDKPAVQATMENIWPHADGSTWTYEMSYRMYEDVLLAEVGNLPTLEELRRDLDEPLPWVPDTTITSYYTLAFEGTTTTRSGVEVQNLVEYVEDAGGFGNGIQSVPDGPRFLPQAKTAAAMDGFEPINGPPTPLFLRGGAFAYEDSGYYGYGGWTTGHNWIYLEGDLSGDSGFSLQVAPGAIDDLWLFGQVRDAGSARVGGVVYRNVVECMYVYDLGEITVLDETGTSVGTAHSYMYGRILFAPRVGPVASHERSRVVMRTAYNPEGSAPTTYWVHEVRCALTERHLP